MAITFVPEPGTVLSCDYTTGFIPPEMVKIRKVVVVSVRYRNTAAIALVVPFSRGAPETVEPWHHMIPANRYPFFDPGFDIWAKADMVTHAGYRRLDRLWVDGRWVAPHLEVRDLIGVQKALLHALALGHLTGSI